MEPVPASRHAGIRATRGSGPVQADSVRGGSSWRHYVPRCSDSSGPGFCRSSYRRWLVASDFVLLIKIEFGRPPSQASEGAHQAVGVLAPLSKLVCDRDARRVSGRRVDHGGFTVSRVVKEFDPVRWAEPLGPAAVEWSLARLEADSAAVSASVGFARGRHPPGWNCYPSRQLRLRSDYFLDADVAGQWIPRT
jgi:hypothetical protein